MLDPQADDPFPEDKLGSWSHIYVAIWPGRDRDLNKLTSVQVSQGHKADAAGRLNGRRGGEHTGGGRRQSDNLARRQQAKISM